LEGAGSVDADALERVACGAGVAVIDGFAFGEAFYAAASGWAERPFRQ
jgi:hypothetical protein